MRRYAIITCVANRRDDVNQVIFDALGERPVNSPLVSAGGQITHYMTSWNVDDAEWAVLQSILASPTLALLDEAELTLDGLAFTRGLMTARGLSLWEDPNMYPVEGPAAAMRRWAGNTTTVTVTKVKIAATVTRSWFGRVWDGIKRLWRKLCRLG
jgi:hypothetical protein